MPYCENYEYSGNSEAVLSAFGATHVLIASFCYLAIAAFSQLPLLAEKFQQKGMCVGLLISIAIFGSHVGKLGNVENSFLSPSHHAVLNRISKKNLKLFLQVFILT